MPIYEFYCADCHTLFSFLSRSVNTTKRPACPRCARPLERRASVFAISSGGGEGEGEESDAPSGEPDDETMERALGSLAHQAEGLDENNPRAMAGLMRKLYEGMGVRLGPGMEEAVRRMEAGEDPDRIEQELGELLDDEQAAVADPGLSLSGLRALSRRARGPAVDRTLYEM